MVKTTLEIPDHIFRKATSGAMGLPLREYVTRALEARLSSSAQPDKQPWLECAGELAYLHAETKRLQKSIELEFGQVEPEDQI